MAETSTLRGLVAVPVHQPRGAHQQARLVDLDPRPGDPVVRMLAWSASGAGRRPAPAHAHQSSSSASLHWPMVRMQWCVAARTERLRQREAIALAAQQVRGAHAHAAEHHSQCPSGEWWFMIGMLRTTRRRACRAAPAIEWRARRGASSRGSETPMTIATFVVRVDRAGGEPLAAVDHVVLAVAADEVCRFVGRTTRRPARSSRRQERISPSSSGTSQRLLRASRTGAAVPCCRCPARCS